MASADYALRIEKRLIVNTLYLVLLFSLLSFSYLNFVVPYYGYMGFDSDISLIKMIEAPILLISSFYLFYRQGRSFSREFIGLIYMFIVPSSLVLYMLSDGSRLFVYSVVTGVILTSYSSNIVIRIVYSGRKRILEYYRRSSRIQLLQNFNWDLILYLLLGSTTLIVFSSLYYYNGLPTLTAVSLDRVYEVRGAVTYGPLLPYLFNWQANVISPLFIVLGLKRNRPSIFIAGVSLQLLLYLYTGHKAVLFTIPFIIAVYIFIENWSLTGGLIKTFSIVIVFSLVFFWLFANIFVPSLLIRRVFFIPPLVRSYYFEFFSTNPLMKLGKSSLGVLWSNPYSESLPVIIGNRYLDGAYANVGYLSSSFADFGVVGVLVFAILAGIMFGLIEYISRGLEPGIVAGVFMMPLFNLDSSRLTTLILTHGLLFALVVGFILRRTNLVRKGQQ